MSKRSLPTATDLELGASNDPFYKGLALVCCIGWQKPLRGMVDIELELQQFAPPAAALYVSDPRPAHQFVLLRLPVGWYGEQHPSPSRQILLCLSGRARVTPGIGEPIFVGPGDVWLMEDTTGEGLETSIVSDVPFDATVVQFPLGLRPPGNAAEYSWTGPVTAKIGPKSSRKAISCTVHGSFFRPSSRETLRSAAASSGRP